MSASAPRSSFVMKSCVPSVGDGTAPQREVRPNFRKVKSCTMEVWQGMMTTVSAGDRPLWSEGASMDILRPADRLVAAAPDGEESAGAELERLRAQVAVLES